jgi:hypothetical protein
MPVYLAKGTRPEKVIIFSFSRTMSDIESNLGTMVINEEEDSTMKQYGTVPGHSSYRWVLAYGFHKNEVTFMNDY